MNSIDELKSIVEHKVNEEDDNVSLIYSAYIQPFCASGGNYNEFLTPNEILIQFPPGIMKIRRYFLQILLLLDIFHSQDKPDPLPDNNMKDLLFLIRSIAPLAPIISESMLLNIFEELNSVHGKFYSQTILFLMKSIGITENDISEDLSKDHADNFRRVHYEDGESVPTGLEYQPNKTVLQNYPLFQSSNNQKKNKIKKPKHGPKIDM